jgi:hypothetical protein
LLWALCSQDGAAELEQGSDVSGALGRRVPETWEHYEKYPLRAELVPNMPVPVVIGVNWYSAFDNPVQDAQGRWWIGRDTNRLGSIRGGHCVCIEPGDLLDETGKVVRRLQDTTGWWDFYNQGNEGACVGFGVTRMLSLLNRKRYDARWLWDWAKSIDDWNDTNPGDDNGTSVNAGLNVAKNKGHVVWKTEYADREYQLRDQETPSISEGVSAFRWTNDVSDVFTALKAPNQTKMGAVRILNSWGRDWPHKVWMPAETLQILTDQEGEIGIPTDR